MSRIYWRAIFAAIGLILFCSLGQAQEETQEKQGQAATQQQPTQTLPVPLPVEIVGDQAAAEARERREKESDQREIDDLVAQQGMNRATQLMNEATQRMAEYSLYSTILVGIGTVLVFTTLVLTWFANRAAVQAVDVTQKVGEAQVRAYLYCKSAKYELRKEWITAILEIGNAGQSPASEVTVIGEMDIYVIGGFPSHPRVHTWLKSQAVDVACQPIISNGQIVEEITFHKEVDFIRVEDESVKTAIFDTGNRIDIELTIKWQDVFSQEHKISVYLDAYIDSSPYSPRKKRTRTGKLNVRMDDTRPDVENA